MRDQLDARVDTSCQPFLGKRKRCLDIMASGMIRTIRLLCSMPMTCRTAHCAFVLAFICHYDHVQPRLSTSCSALDIVLYYLLFRFSRRCVEVRPNSQV